MPTYLHSCVSCAYSTEEFRPIAEWNQNPCCTNSAHGTMPQVFVPAYPPMVQPDWRPLRNVAEAPAVQPDGSLRWGVIDGRRDYKEQVARLKDRGVHPAH